MSVSLWVVWDAAVQIISKSLVYGMHSKLYVSKEFIIFLVNEKATCFLQRNGICSVESMASTDLPASNKASGF